MSEITLFVSPENEGDRIDKYVSENIDDLTRNAVQKLIDTGNISVNDKAVKSNYKLKQNDSIKIIIPDPTQLTVIPENIPLDIIYEDDYLLVVNKAKGMVVHPAVGNYSGTLVNALMHHCGDSLSGINGVIRPGIVHRIDKDTSGLLIVAKNDIAHIGLAEQIKEHSFKREYESVVCGNLKNDTGVVDAPIGRHPMDRKKMAVTSKNSRNAITHYEVLERFGNYTHLRLRLETGRTHQIRVHMAYLGHPVVGDVVYGKGDKRLLGQCLHAKTIGFIHPKTDEYLEFSSDLPTYFKDFLKSVNK